MVTNKTHEYGIKYRVININPTQYLMIPVSLEGGLSDSFTFSTDKEVYHIANEKKDLSYKYVMDNVFLTEELEEIYELDDDTDTLSEYFFEEHKNIVYLVNVNKDNTLNKYAINLSKFHERQYDMTYHMDESVPAITLNEDLLNEILAANDIHEVKILLEKYKALVKSFDEFHKKHGVTTINIRDGEVESFQTTKDIDGVTTKEKVVSKPKSDDKEVVPFGGVDVTYNGLRKAIKEKVFGHDEEIDTFAQKLYMNYTAQDGDSVESILLVGPTGTGKTETVTAACDYLYIPYFEANAANLVPQGIRGMSIEDVLISLFEASGRDIKRAQRGLVFLDEFDKINETDLEIKSAVKPVLLSFSGGGNITVRNDYYDFTFNSKMTNKVYAGVFQRISENPRTLGFGVEDDPKPLGSEKEIRKKIIDKGYFTLEELTRITTILGYNELSRDTKRQILLSSKISEFAKKRERYKRQFGIDLLANDDYIEALLDSISNSETGMRSVNNTVKSTIDSAEKAILENEGKGYKKLVLTKDTVSDPSKFDLS